MIDKEGGYSGLLVMYSGRRHCGRETEGGQGGGRGRENIGETESRERSLPTIAVRSPHSVLVGGRVLVVERRRVERVRRRRRRGWEGGVVVLVGMVRGELGVP